MKPVTGFDLLELVGKSRLLEADAIQQWHEQCSEEATAEQVARAMVEAGVLSAWHTSDCERNGASRTVCQQNMKYRTARAVTLTITGASGLSLNEFAATAE